MFLLIAYDMDKLAKLFALALILFAPLCDNKQLSAKPNIVFILADDLGHNDIGYHAKLHKSDIRTPFLDELASKGIKLENYYVQPICTPTRSQLMSGRYQIHTGLQHSYIHPDQPNALPLDNKLLPEQLRDCGYDTHMVGKWHLGDYKTEYLPWKRGFNSYTGYLTGSENYYTRVQCWGSDGCGVDFWNSTSGPDNSTWGEYSAQLYTEKAMKAIDNRDRSKPLFLYLAYQSVHSPMQAPEKYVKPFSHIKDHNRRIYAGMVSALDEAVANLTTYLDRVGMLDNTIIIFSTDNGGQTLAGGNNWPLRGRKVTLWEGGVKGVGFMYGKPLGLQGVVHDQLLHVSDWFPTILAATNCPVINGTLSLDGFDQWNAILQIENSPRIEILHNIDPLYPRPVVSVRAPSGFDVAVHAAIRRGQWKLLTGDPGFDKWVMPPESQPPDGKENSNQNKIFEVPQLIQLYNIQEDPYEEHEVSAQYPEIVNELLERLVAHNKTSVPVMFPATDQRSYPKYNDGFWGPWLK